MKYLKALDHFYRYSKEDNHSARRLAEEAIALDPDYACAYSLLGAIHRQAVYLRSTSSPKRSFAAAKEMAEKAIDLNPSLAGPRAVLSGIFRSTGQYQKAIVEAEKAVAHDPNSILANGAMGNALTHAGRAEESIPFLKKAIRLDPFSTSYFFPLGQSFFLSGQYEEAIRICKRATDRNPHRLEPHLCLAAAYSAARREKETHASASEVFRINPQFSLERTFKFVRYKKQSDKELIISNLRKAGLK